MIITNTLGNLPNIASKPLNTKPRKYQKGEIHSTAVLEHLIMTGLPIKNAKCIRSTTVI